MSEEKRCHFCGDTDSPHMLSDCRPDLVKHEIGPTCTWWYSSVLGVVDRKHSCYAYQDFWSREWTGEHVHFHEDCDMTL
jgi:hypothetical protein